MSQTLGAKLETTYSALLTATAETAVLSIIFHNTTATTRIVTLNSYPAPAGTSADGDEQIAVIYINGYNTFTYSGDEKLLIDTGDVIEAKCDAAAAVNAKVCYKVIG